MHKFSSSWHRWQDAEAEGYDSLFRSRGGVLLAQRVYTSQLIGRDSRLVLHGGGNTSVKLRVKNALGEDVDVVAVKGSGWSLDTIEPEGFPMVDLAHCRKLRKLDRLSDEDMVNEMRTHLLNAKSPNPSVETLLHAFLPHTYVDHSHADAIVSLVDQPEERVHQVLKKAFHGMKFAVVPYIMPGFALAKLAAEVYERNPDCEALILLKHGLFTFGETAKESYLRHMAFVQRAYEFLAQEHIVHETPKPYCFCTLEFKCPTEHAAFGLLDTEAAGEKLHALKTLHSVAPVLRGVLADLSGGTSWILSHRPGYIQLANAPVRDLSAICKGPATPDHVIRTKGKPVLIRLTAQELENEDALRAAIHKSMVQFGEQYHEYFTRMGKRCAEHKVELDRLPRVALIEHVGLVCMGRTHKESTIAADIFEHTMSVVTAAERIGDYDPVNEQDRFDMEYWTLEQAKLKVAAKKTAGRVESRVCLVTGAASGIGLETCRVFGREGALVFLIDVQADDLQGAVESLRKEKIVCASHAADVSSRAEMQAAFNACVETFGGADVVVSNAGIAVQGAIGTVDDDTLYKSFDVNFFGHQHTASLAVSIMSRQASGGVLLFNASKAALLPGKQFGPYCTAKAATLMLMKQYALEYGSKCIRSNAVNADRVRTALFTEDVIRQRTQALGISEQEYFASNLLNKQVTASDVATAFLNLATMEKTTGAVLTVDGGNVAASVR